MKADADGGRQGSRRTRVAATLCVAGAIAIGFGGGVLGAGAQTAAPAETSTATVPAGPGPPAEPPADSGTTSTTPGATSTTPGTTSTTPAGDAAPEPPSSTGGADGPAHPAPADAGRPSTGASSDPLAVDSQSAGPLLGPARPGAPAKPLPMGQLAGPVQLPTTSGACRRASPRRTDRRKRARALADRPRDSAARCESRAPSENTILFQRGDAPPRVHRRDREGVPTVANPSLSLSVPGAVAVGMPDFFIDKFRIPPFLLPIFQAAATEFGVRWEVLAAINEIETDYGRNLNVSSAGALGWMQFMPPTWELYGTDANRDGRRDRSTRSMRSLPRPAI